MRIEIGDHNGQVHDIETMNARLAGEWFAEWSRFLMSANASLGYCRLRIWPSTQEEQGKIGQWDGYLTEEGLLALADQIIEASKLAKASKNRLG